MDPSLQAAFRELVDALNGRNQPNPNNGQGQNLQSFDESQETFASYLQRVDNFFALKKITADGEKVQIFINALSPGTHQTLSSLTAPDRPNTKDFKTLTELLKNHISPPSSVYAEQHKFNLRTQNEGEPISNYVADLKLHTTRCEFVCEHYHVLPQIRI